MKIVKNILFWATTVFLILAIVAVAVPKIFGVEFRSVLTGSMEPEIPVGSLVVIVPTKAEKIQVGDDVTFVSQSGKVVTHRVIEIDREANTFTTYGIANGISNKDNANRYENIIGVVRLHVPVIGRVFSWFATTTGKIISITAILAIYLITALISVLFGTKKEVTAQAVTALNEMPGTGNPSLATETPTVLHDDGSTEEAEKMKKGKKRKPENTDEFWTGDN